MSAPPSNPRRIFITAAEVSGDKHAAQLVRSLRELDPDIQVEGHGGPEMAAAGATIHFETVGKAAMGWRGALRAAEIYKVLRWTKRHYEQSRPDLQIGVDSPSMNFHFAKAAHARGIPVMQYVAPQLWAWREGRMKKLRKWVDHLACILPFEEAYFRRHGVRATFVGHPLFDELPPQREVPGPKFPDRPPVIGVLPGSRKSEAEANFPPLLVAAARVREAFPGATFLVPTTPATHPVVEAALRPGNGAPPAESSSVAAATTFRVDAFDELVPRCDLCLTVSGTATLHVAGFGVPMIVVYRGNPVLWHGIGRWLVRINTFALVNLLADPNPTDPDSRRHIVPEFMPWFGDPEPVAAKALELLRDPDRLRQQRRMLNRLVGTLDRPGASMHTAHLALEMIGAAAPAGSAPGAGEGQNSAVPELG